MSVSSHTDELDSSATTFVDFDHTLLGANSTELFIGFCRPSIVAALIDFLVRRCFPWAIFRVEKSYRLRDYVCCLVLVVLTPWNLVRWRRDAPALFEIWKSRAVDAMLPSPASVVIVSFGIVAVIEPMLRSSRWAGRPVIATTLLTGLDYFRRGKVDLVRARFDDATVARSRFITDSEDDRDLLDAAGDGVLIEPQGERNIAAHRLYLPFRYTLGAKYPRGYVVDQFLFVDVCLLIVCAATDLRSLAQFAVIAPLMVASFMCVYEIGYFENDFVGASREATPTLTPSVRSYEHYPIAVNAWVWAALLGAAGIFAADFCGLLKLRPELAGLAWAAILLLARATFYVYNRQPSHSRLYLYVLLQLEKSGLIFVVLPSTLLGIVMVASHVITMWIVYIVYRLGGRRKELEKEWLRPTIFVISAGLLVLADPARLAGQALPLTFILAWSALRLAKQPLMRRLRPRT